MTKDINYSLSEENAELLCKYFHLNHDYLSEGEICGLLDRLLDVTLTPKSGDEGMQRIDLSKLPNKLYELRMNKGKNIKQVERATGISWSGIHKYENGQNLPSLLSVIALAEYYGMSVSELLGEYTHD